MFAQSQRAVVVRVLYLHLHLMSLLQHDDLGGDRHGVDTVSSAPL